MERYPKTVVEINELLQVSELLTGAVRTVIDEWAKETRDITPSGTVAFLPSQELHQAQRTILAIAGKLIELVSEPSQRILEVACQYWECRALSVAAERRIPDLLAAKGDEGVEIAVLAKTTTIESAKLCEF